MEFFDGTTTTLATQLNINNLLAGATSLIVRAEYWSSVTPDHAFLGNVVVAGSIPEPETYAMPLAGPGVLGFAARRRQRKAVQA